MTRYGRTKELMKIQKINPDDLVAWQRGPVGEAMREALLEKHGVMKKAALEAYWGGQPWPEVEVRAVQVLGELIEDIFEPTHEDVKAIMEQISDKFIGVETH